jgi:hypothetical protein
MNDVRSAVREPAGPAGPWFRTFDMLRHAPLLICGAATLFYLSFMARASVGYGGRAYFTLFDDAMISLRYAKTLASGGGFTWNPGEKPIEGITNPLWTLWMAVLHFAPVPEGWVAFLVGLSSAALLIATAFGARALARRLGADDTAGLVVLAIVAFYYPLVFWSLRGMETGVLACLMTWAMVLVLDQMDRPDERRPVSLALIAVALLWVRQDAVVFLVVLAGFVAVAGGPRLRFTARTLVGSLLLGLALLTMFRLYYYGSTLPNTYYLKVTGVSLMERLDRGFASLFARALRWHYAPILAAVLLALPFVLRRPPAALMRLALPLAVFLAQAAYSVYVGGDVWELMGYPNRYLVIAMPGLLALAVVAISIVASGIAEGPGRLGELLNGAGLDRTLLARAALGAMAIALFSMTSVVHLLAWARQGAAYAEYDRAATQVGLCLRENTKPGTRIAYTWAGSMPYYADRFGIDLLGKMDAVIARSTPQIEFQPGHNKWDYIYSISAHKPDIVLQLFRAKPGDHDRIREHGYRNMERSWPCFANTFLAPEDVFVRQ